MPRNKDIEFVTVGQKPLDSENQLTVSAMKHKENGITAAYINLYVKTEKYEGPTKGIKVSAEDIPWLMIQLRQIAVTAGVKMEEV